MSEVRAVSHAEADEMAGLYVLNALGPAEMASVRAHLATCPEDHSVFADLGGVIPALAASIEPVDAPPELRARVLGAISAEAGELVAVADAPAPVMRPPETVRGARLRGLFERRIALGWGAAAAAALILAVVGTWAFTLQARNESLEQRQELIAQALVARDAAGAEVAQLSGSGGATGASGFAALTPRGETYILMVGLPPAPAGQTYQAWYIADGAPVSAGLITVGDDGLGVLRGASPPGGTRIVALTLERTGGADQPTSDPIVAGELEA